MPGGSGESFPGRDPEADDGKAVLGLSLRQMRFSLIPGWCLRQKKLVIGDRLGERPVKVRSRQHLTVAGLWLRVGNPTHKVAG